MNRKLLQLAIDNQRGAGLAAVRCEASEEVAHVYVSDVIDSYWGASAKMMIEALAGAGGKNIELHINSPGGDVFEGRAMAAAIVNYAGKVTAHIEGMCASAATYVALAADEVRMMEGSLFMIHNSWTMAWGDKSELRTTADLLDKIDGTIIADYMRKTGASAEQVVEWMNATTWFTAQEALDAKFIDQIETNSKGAAAAQARWNLSAYPNAPKQEAAPPAPDPAAVAALIEQQVQRNSNRLRLLIPI